jgi:hypothetical protein
MPYTARRAQSLTAAYVVKGAHEAACAQSSSVTAASAAVAGLECDCSTGCARRATLQSKFDTFALERPDIARTGLSYFLSPEVSCECLCAGCAASDGALGLMDTKFTKLKAQEVRQHLAAHGKDPSLKGEALKAAMAELVGLHAKVLVSVCEAPSPAAPTLVEPLKEANTVLSPLPGRKPGRPFELSSTTKEQLSPQPPKDGVVLRSERAQRLAAAAAAAAEPLPEFPDYFDFPNLFGESKWAAHRRFQYIVAARATCFSHCFLYADYVRNVHGISDPAWSDLTSPLSPDAWRELAGLMTACTLSAHRSYERAAQELLPTLVYDIRRGADACWKEYWPFGFQADGASFVLTDDMAWCTRGAHAENGTSHRVAYPYQLTTHCVHYSKGTHRVLAHFPDIVVQGWSEASGGMDCAATVKMSERMAKLPRSQFGKGILGRDGDVHATAVNALPGCAQWTGARCFCHVCKNVRVNLSQHMSSKDCPGDCPGLSGGPKKGGSDCRHAKNGSRFKADMAGKVSKRVLWILKNAVHIYLPELEEGSMRRGCDVGSEERKEKRLVAIEFARRQLLGCLLHCTGEHSLCEHAPVPADYPAVKCKGQVSFLAKVLLSVEVALPELLTDVGLIHVNVNECDNSILARFRTKDVQWPALNNALASSFAFLNWQQLRLAFWDPDHRRYPEMEVFKEVMDYLGIEARPSSAEVEAQRRDLEERLCKKEQRSDPLVAKKTAETRAKKKAKKASAGASSYAGQGTEEGLRRAISPALSRAAAAAPTPAAVVGIEDFYGGGAGGLTTEEEALVNGAVTDADRASGDEERGL